MKEKMLICFFMIAGFFFFVSCGEETDSNSFNSINGTELNRTEMRKARFKPAPTVWKKSPLRPLNTQTWGPVSTGQTQCFDHEKQIECPTSPRDLLFFQDRNRIGTRSLTSANDGQTIKDDVTDRLWSRHIKEDVTWYEAKYYCESLKMAGKRWRLPTTAELRSLVNYGAVDPAIDAIFYDDIDPQSLSKQFWASDHSYFKSETPVNDKEMYAAAWIINFYDGFVEYTSRYNTYNVRCVTEE
ncbi:MAG: DUF1566 domain-containing protein [Spirochaetaceae bacterium]|nr:DUF1566 domain-containing protein [Spirochaetaceae bacterium]